MKNILLLLVLSCLFTGCKPSAPDVDNAPVKIVTVDTSPSLQVDTIEQQPIYSRCDSLEREIRALYLQVDTLLLLNDTLSAKLFLSNYKVEKVRRYLQICQRNPAQNKFLKGWVKRAVE